MGTLGFNELEEQGTSSGSKDCWMQQPFRRLPYFVPKEIEWREYSQDLAIQSQMLWHRKEVKKYFLTYPIPAYSSSYLRLYWVHPLVAPRFLQNILILPKAGRLKYFLKNCSKLTNIPKSFSGCCNIRIHFTVQPEQMKFPRVAIMSQEETDLIDQQIREMLSMGAISVAKNLEGQLLSSLFL